MKVGDYVRTNDGYIAKYLGCKTNSANQLFHYFDGTIRNIASYVYEEDRFLWDDELKNIIKTSSNIIDLIEVGDIITFKDDEDVYKVIGRPDKECALEVFYLAKKYDGNTEDIMVYPDEMKKYIKSILTKEQFESMEYKIGE